MRHDVELRIALILPHFHYDFQFFFVGHQFKNDILPFSHLILVYFRDDLRILVIALLFFVLENYFAVLIIEMHLRIKLCPCF